MYFFPFADTLFQVSLTPLALLLLCIPSVCTLACKFFCCFSFTDSRFCVVSELRPHPLHVVSTPLASSGCIDALASMLWPQHPSAPQVHSFFNFFLSFAHSRISSCPSLVPHPQPYPLHAARCVNPPSPGLCWSHQCPMGSAHYVVPLGPIRYADAHGMCTQALTMIILSTLRHTCSARVLTSLTL